MTVTGLRQSRPRSCVENGLRTEFDVAAVFERRSGGDRGLWNELTACGHGIQPHGCHQTDMCSIPLAQVQDLIQRCLSISTEKLSGFVATGSNFSFRIMRQPKGIPSLDVGVWTMAVVVGILLLLFPASRDMATEHWQMLTQPASSTSLRT